MQVSLSALKHLLPWYIKFIERETCCCKHCENFRCYLDALNEIADMLSVLLPSPAVDDADADDKSEGASSVSEIPLVKLVRVCKLKSKQMVANEFVCGGAISEAKPDC